MKKSRADALRAGGKVFLLCCVVYFMLDCPIRLTGAYGFPDGIGIKNFLPFSCGLFFGPAGVLGAAAGAVLTVPLLPLRSLILAAFVDGLESREADS